MEAQAEEQAAEGQKERKLRERNEQYSRQLEEELEGLKVSLQNHTDERQSVLLQSWCVLYIYKLVGGIWPLINL